MTNFTHTTRGPVPYKGHGRFPVEFAIFATGRVIATEFIKVVDEDGYEAVEVRAEHYAAIHGAEIDIYICGDRAGIRVRPA